MDFNIEAGINSTSYSDSVREAWTHTYLLALKSELVLFQVRVKKTSSQILKNVKYCDSSGLRLSGSKTDYARMPLVHLSSAV